MQRPKKTSFHLYPRIRPIGFRFFDSKGSDSFLRLSNCDDESKGYQRLTESFRFLVNELEKVILKKTVPSNTRCAFRMCSLANRG